MDQMDFNIVHTLFTVNITSRMVLDINIVVIVISTSAPLILLWRIFESFCTASNTDPNT